MAATVKAPGFFRRLTTSLKDKVTAAARDYRESFRLTVADARESPGKTALWLGTFGALVFTGRHAPSAGDYRAQLQQYCTEVGLLSESARNQRSYEYLKRMAELRSEGRLRVHNLLLFTLLRRTDFNPDVNSSKALGLQGINPVRGFVESVEDIGWMDRWFYLELAMRDYDVPDE